MTTALEHPDIAQFNARARDAVGKIMECWSPAGPAFIVPEQTDLFRLPQVVERGPDTVFRVTEGRLSYLREEKPVFHYEADWLVGLLGERERAEIEVQRTFDEEKTVVAPYDMGELKALFEGKPELAVHWQHYNQALMRIMVAVSEQHVSTLPRIAPHVVHFEAGEVLMREDEASAHAFYLLDGRAKVVVGGETIVGEVSAGQLLGHLGLLKGGPRTATVVAESPCEAIALDEPQLLSLLQVRPDLCKTVLAQLAGTVGQLNRTVSDLA